MTYRVRSAMLGADDSYGAASEVAEVIKDAGALDFKRGQLKLTDESVIFAPSTSESRILDAVSNLSTIFSAMLFFHDQYKTSFESAHRYDGYQKIPYVSISGVSVINKGKVSEVCIETTELPDDTYLRLRVDEGTYAWPIYNGNRKYAKKIGAEILGFAKKHGGAVEFDAGGVYSGPTKHIPIQPSDPDAVSTGESSSWKKRGVNTFFASILIWGGAIVLVDGGLVAGLFSVISAALLLLSFIFIIIGFIK